VRPSRLTFHLFTAAQPSVDVSRSELPLSDQGRERSVVDGFPQGFIPSLDGWRALAIILVLGDHMVYSNDYPEAWKVRTAAIFHGDLGVRLFFVLSGFLITTLLFREVRRTGGISLRGFFIRRGLRILPVAMVFLGCLAILTGFGLYHDPLTSWLGSLTFTRNYMGSGGSATVHYWSLSVEEQFYVVWPSILAGAALWRRQGVFLALLAVPLVVCPMMRCWWIREGTGLVNHLLGMRSIAVYADSLAIGCLGAWIVDRNWPLISWLRAGGWWVVPLAVLSLAMGRIEDLDVIPVSPWAHALIPSWQALGILAALIASTSPACGVIYRFLNHRVMAGLGRLSYSLYIWHMVFIGYCFEGRSRGWVTHEWYWWIPCAVVVAWMSYRFIEQPCLRLRSRFVGV
jgi:peptidoglycan/LPS O-acetylase OafA/YrhL